MQTRDNIIAPFNNPLIRLISDNRYRWLRHTLFIMVGLILAFKGDIGVPNQYTDEVQKAVLIADSISFVFILGIIYLLLFVFVPRLLFRSKLFLFSLSFIAGIVLIYLAVWAVDYYILRPVNPGNMQHIDLSIVHFIQVGTVCAVLLASVVGMKVFKKWINDVQRMNELQQVNLKTELAQLKSQVNPHFLFNTLNNLLVLVKTDTDKASQVLLGLSDLLRYQLYDSTREKILLSKDIAFMQNLLELEKIRKNDFTYTIHTEGHVDGQSLPPFLFIPFVENAIKHGASTVGHSYLTLWFKIKEKQLHFRSENSKPAIKTSMAGGLGLGNIKRRLELLYPDNHTLQITDDTDKYIVNLTIPL
ncbi:MAG: histidine kinase [Chitinophagaceae bacterium]